MLRLFVAILIDKGKEKRQSRTRLPAQNSSPLWSRHPAVITNVLIGQKSLTLKNPVLHEQTRMCV